MIADILCMSSSNILFINVYDQHTNGIICGVINSILYGGHISDLRQRQLEFITIVMSYGALDKSLSLWALVSHLLDDDILSIR